MPLKFTSPIVMDFERQRQPTQAAIGTKFASAKILLKSESLLKKQLSTGKKHIGKSVSRHDNTSYRFK